MDVSTLPAVPTTAAPLGRTTATTTAAPFGATTTAAPLGATTTAAPSWETTTAAPSLESTERVELSVVEKMVIGVAIAVTIILIGILVSLSTRK